MSIIVIMPQASGSGKPGYRPGYMALSVVRNE
jgi:hypothetical protein